ncbi:nicotinate-nucleotide--dimethylbenzimidazole phosphoribosyltransferase [Balneatrix alpica]|uniref:Nicotinate-nucleotide--dimethylbenzimidazole phosphoribosyltransferase n=1 Tax=Balneatrix alpica TaxID=75684 RepID=A0ABV5Z8R6_9GAMM|nr:nicotinate-nucleotide--dimethylbenzimidazole phosphoribosyltransferase [Balneatrix alpica]
MTDYWFEAPIKTPRESVRQQARHYQQQLAKQAGALGRLEELAIELAALQNTPRPAVDPVQLTVFAADHGLCQAINPSLLGLAEGERAAEHTQQRVRSFARGGAPISILARNQGARFEVVNVGMQDTLEPLQGVLSRKAVSGSDNLLQQPALSENDCFKAMAVGRDRVDSAWEAGCRLWVGGELGCGASLVATVVAFTLLGGQSEFYCDAQEPEKLRFERCQLLEQAQARWSGKEQPPLEVLQQLGGADLAALVGGYLRCAQLGLPALVDGLVGSVAALLAVQLQPGAREWLLFAQQDAEPGHARVLRALEAKPILNLQLRQGEAAGAAIALGVLRQACQLHNEMEQRKDW